MPEKEKVYKFRELEFYAKMGFVKLIDNEHGREKDITPGDFMQRAIALRTNEEAIYRKRNSKPTRAQRQEYQEVRKFFFDAADCCKLARKQGDPTSAKTVAHMVKHFRPGRILVPGMPEMQQATRPFDFNKQVKPSGQIDTVKKKLIIPGA